MRFWLRCNLHILLCKFIRCAVVLLCCVVLWMRARLFVCVFYFLFAFFLTCFEYFVCALVSYRNTFPKLKPKKPANCRDLSIFFLFFWNSKWLRLNDGYHESYRQFLTHKSSSSSRLLLLLFSQNVLNKLNKVKTTIDDLK